MKLIVSVEVTKGYEPIIGAKVEVQVGSTPWKLMNDNGLGEYNISYYIACNHISNTLRKCYVCTTSMILI